MAGIQINIPKSRLRFFLFALFFGALGMAVTALAFYRSTTGFEEVIGFTLLAFVGAAVATVSRSWTSKASK